LLAEIFPNTPDRYFVHVICKVEEYFPKISLDGESVGAGPVAGKNHLQGIEDLLININIILGFDFQRCDKPSCFILCFDQQCSLFFSSIPMNNGVVHSNIENPFENFLCIVSNICLHCHDIIHLSNSIFFQGLDYWLQKWSLSF